jgi:subtilisin
MFISKANEMNLPILYNLKYFNKRHSKQFKEANVLWNLKNIGADIAWKTTIGQGAKIMVIDTGIQYSHPELECRFDSDKGWNFIDDNNDPDDDNGHGTHCAGICAGADTGVAPGAGLIAGKVLDENGSGSTTDIISAIDYGINKARPDIISMSLGSRYPSNALEAICVEANRSGIIVCAAAGNEYFGPSYPAACNGVISVAAVDLNNDHAEFSNIDSSVDISCPGVDIYSTYPRNGHATLSGTSMATPGAAGCAALSVSVNSLSPEKYEKIMAETAEEICPDEPQWEEKFGSGLIRPDKIIDKLGKSYKEGNRRSHDIFTENIFNNSKECVREYKKVLSHLKNAVSFGKNISRDIGTELWRKYGR